MGTGKEMAIQRHLHLPKLNSEVLQAQGHPSPGQGEQSLWSMTSAIEPNTAPYAQSALKQHLEN